MKSSTFKKAVSFFALASAFTMAGCQKDGVLEETATAPVTPASSATLVEGKYIVVLKNGGPEELRGRLLKKLGISGERMSDLAGGFTGKLSREEVQRLLRDGDVAFVEQEQAVMLGKPTKAPKGGGSTDTSTGGTTDTSTGGTTTDTSTGSTTTETSSGTTTTATTSYPNSTQVIPWNIARVGYGDGTGKTVWVIDSGVQTNHPDLNVDVARSKSFITGDASIEDGYGHGTAVAGIIGAKNNGEGIIGVAANASIVALRVFDNTGYGTLTRIYSALNHVYQYGKPGDVVNMSLGVSASSMLDDLVKKVAARGIYVAVAAGNSSADCSTISPARVIAPNVYVVSNMTSLSAFSPYSNFGQSVNVAAPGTDVQMTWKGSGYTYGNGTSYAAPHVAGILALTGKVNSQGLVSGDPDGKPDPIALK
ncbi:S8 family peptidase [Rufibacter soli]